MRKKRIYMETTSIPVGQTVAEIQRTIGEYGATAVLVEYDQGEVVGISFKIIFIDRTLPIKLPCRWQAIFNVMYARKKRGTHNERVLESMKEQAKRVAMRQVLCWVKAQLAFCDTDMVKVLEVFLSYVQVGPQGETLFEQVENNKLPMLTYEPPSG